MLIEAEKYIFNKSPQQVEELFFDLDLNNVKNFKKCFDVFYSIKKIIHKTPGSCYREWRYLEIIKNSTEKDFKAIYKELKNKHKFYKTRKPILIKDVIVPYFNLEKIPKQLHKSKDDWIAIQIDIINKNYKYSGNIAFALYFFIELVKNIIRIEYRLLKGAKSDIEYEVFMEKLELDKNW